MFFVEKPPNIKVDIQMQNLPEFCYIRYIEDGPFGVAINWQSCEIVYTKFIV